jgi:hypothetical protein
VVVPETLWSGRAEPKQAGVMGRLAPRRETSQLRQTSPPHIFSVLHQPPVWFFLYRVSTLISLPTELFLLKYALRASLSFLDSTAA